MDYYECSERKEKDVKPEGYVRFHPSLHNAETLLGLTAKQCVLPDSGGKKDFSPDDRSVQKIESFFEELETVLGEERVCKLNSLSVGTWDSAKKLIRVEKANGPHWQRFGVVIDKTVYALPEEGLFLLEQGLLEIYYNELPMSMQQAWALLTCHLPSMEYYHAFTHLCRLGFSVIKCPSKNTKRESEKCLKRIRDKTSGPEEEKICQVERAQTGSPCNKLSPGIIPSNHTMSGIHKDLQGACKSEKFPSQLTTQPVVQTETGRTKPDKSDMSQENDLEDDHALVSPSDAKSPEAILSKLQIIKPLISHSSSCEKEALSCLNVYQKTSGFKKSNPGMPDFKVTALKYTDPPPNNDQLAGLISEAGCTPLKLAVCNRGTTTFYELMNVDVSQDLYKEDL